MWRHDARTGSALGSEAKGLGWPYGDTPTVVLTSRVRLGLADELRYSILPILIGDGISLSEGLDTEVQLHLLEVKAYRSGTVALRHEVRK